MTVTAVAVVLLVGAAAPQILVVPEPDMSGVEATVRQQLVSAQTLADAVAGDPEAEPAERAEAYGAVGRLYHAYDFREAAEACYRNAAIQAPADSRWPYLLGILLQSQGELEQAEAAFRKVLASEPRDPAARFHLGEVLRDQNRLAEAELEFFESLSSGGGSAARAALGQIAMLRRDFQTAIEHFQAAVEATPAATRLHYLLGMAYRASGDAERARAHLAESGPVGVTVPDPIVEELETLKRGERIHLLRGRTAFRMGRFEEAVAAFREAVAEDPESYRARVNLATALGSTGETDESIASYRKALALSPEGEAAHFNLGLLLNRRGLHEEAARHLERAVEALPNDATAHLELARAYRAGGRPDEALVHYDRAERSSSSPSEDAVLEAAQMLTDLERFDEALTTLRASLERDPTRGRTSAALARFLAANPDRELRDGKSALELASRVFSASPTPFHAETVAMALAEIGRCADAVAWQEKAVAASATADTPQARLELMRQRLDRYRGSRPCSPP